MSQGALNFRSRCFALPKSGSSKLEYEDAAAADDTAGRFAVADGASESISAGEWAQMLADAYVAGPPDEKNFAEWLHPIQKKWQSNLSRRPAPWYIEEKLRDGAFAAFLGLFVEEPDKSAVASWHALAVGDCCLFRIRADAEVRSFPMESAGGFDTRPDLVNSRRSRSTGPKKCTGSFRRGDQLLLMTDALAHWFLTEHEADRKPWRELNRLTNDEFGGWIETLRKARQLKNDDVTLLLIEFVG